MKNEPFVSIPLWEYNELIKLKKDFEKKFNEKAIVITKDSQFMGHSVFPVNTFRIINETDLIKELIFLLKIYQKDSADSFNKLYSLTNKKRFF